MKKASTRTSSSNKLTVSDSSRAAFARVKQQSSEDAPVMPPEYWANATIGKYYRPVKTQISLRIDSEVLDWLKSKGEGHLSRINEILRARMTEERR